jgi:hypothetical protein
MSIAFNEDDDAWICHSYQISAQRPAITLTVNGENKPDDEQIASIVRTLADVEELIRQASELILENYSYEHLKKLGIEESLLLKEETAHAMSKVATLESAWFIDPACDEFELSFTVPWDSYHVFSVEFSDGEAVCCSVNG